MLNVLKTEVSPGASKCCISFQSVFDSRRLISEFMDEDDAHCDTEELDAQTKNTDEELFKSIEPFHIVQRLDTKCKQAPNPSTIRIYARSPVLLQSPEGDDFTHPSVITVERAALCQIFLETKYHKTLEQPSERESRRQTLQSLVCKGKELTSQQRDKFNDILKSVESEWSRLSRVRPSIDAFEIEQRLGAGGFGIVNLVKEKSTGNLYAMKVSIDETRLMVVDIQGQDTSNGTRRPCLMRARSSQEGLGIRLKMDLQNVLCFSRHASSVSLCKSHLTQGI
jgi:hypothetical protein